MAMAQEDGRSRIERVLDPSFVEDLTSIDLGELRRRRDDALAEREYQSYLRRLIQVRQDIVRAEHDRRVSGGAAQSVVDQLTSVLSEGPPRGPARGEALPLGPSGADMEEAERRADAAPGGVSLSDLQALDVAELESALEALGEVERDVSSSRAGVLRVHDQLHEELKRRYREDPSLIPTQV
jgi:hypothetical protein